MNRSDHQPPPAPLSALTAPGGPFATEERTIGDRTLPVYVNGPQVLRELLESTRAHGDRLFLRSTDRSYTYAQLYAAASALANRFLAPERADDGSGTVGGGYGLVKGDRVVIAMRNHAEWQVAFWATQLAGLIAVPMNAWWSAEEMARALAHCAPRALVVDGERVPRVRPWRLAQPQAEQPWLLTVRHDAAEGPRSERFEDLPATDPAAPAAAPAVPVDPADTATLLYTSGTTGDPKGVTASQLNYCAAAMNPRYFAVCSALERGESPTAIRPQTSLMTFPFFHVASFAVVLATMLGGGTLLLMRRWNAAEALAIIEEQQATTYVGVPATALELLAAAEGAGSSLPSLGLVNTGGAAAPPELLRRVDRVFGGRVDSRNGYGLTETCGAVVVNYGARYREHPDSIGRPSPATRTRIAGPDGAPAADGEVGELQLRGQAIFQGYWDNPQATADAFADGWFRTGDLALVRDGEVYVVDRLKDVVIRGGENVYCVEVEAVLFEHPEVADAAVLGVPHPVLGEEVAALVQLRPGSAATAEELRAHVRARLAAFKAPAHILFRPDALPRNATGKIVKRSLRAEVVAALGG
ncbi:class I adenylate-forming enzyme family protein [Streptacidiphilus sp. PB12-B1b]|uniref:class I adenylate-forming enzyme family protein n=1 Tax=Streptacidiphilus sp. PB12-B1b TaxID=2705012 RepID=UPI001CDBF43F|nr:class I adenylate-forming enzyme family protein [Streptacidiphilus sp. PB12-B1b]